MMSLDTLYPLLIPLAPFIAAIFTMLPQRLLNHKNYSIGWWMMFASFVMSLLVLSHAIQTPEPIRMTLFALPWKFLPVVQLSFDRLAAVMLAMISGFGTVLYSYSARYLQQDDGLSRYLTLMTLKLSFQLVMVASADLLTLFICWQLLSWFLTLLFHNYAHGPTTRGSFRTFIILRAGDMAFLSGIVLAYHLYGTVQFMPLFERAATDPTLLNLFGTGLHMTGATAVTLLIFIGAMCKSAQFPMHVWLPDSLYSPTPISSLLHAGGINAGGFLLTRLAPLFILSPPTLHGVLFVGLVTAILGTGMMLVQNDIKKALGYSTIGQMGYMMMECGLGAFSLAVFHLISHGLFKANLFLNSGNGIHDARLHPAKPERPAPPSPLNRLGWITVFLLSFVIPLLITVGVHHLIGISFFDSQGLLILLLFSWVTASQAMLTVFRLKKTWLMKGGTLLAITVLATVYFFAAEAFMQFLNPDPSVAEQYLHLAQLPFAVFFPLIALLIISIASGWLFSVYQQHKPFSKGSPVALVARPKQWLYLLFMNRLYIDGITQRLLAALKHVGRRIDQSPVIYASVALIVLAIVFVQTPELVAIPLKTIGLLLLSAILVPLFPFHGVYVSALTRAPRTLATGLCVLMPATGMGVLALAVPEVPGELLPAISTLALFGAFWGSIKALLQLKVASLLAYGALALYSILWWHIAQAGHVTPHALLFTWTVTLVWGGLYLAWDRVRVRVGNLELSHISGLFKPMPRFALCMGLLIMASVGLPPFGLFFGYLGILLNPSTGISIGMFVIIGTWLVGCWYLFKLMQQLLFGPCRQDVRYDDLRPAEMAVFVLVLALLVLPCGIPRDWLNTTFTEVAYISGRTP